MTGNDNGYFQAGFVVDDLDAALTHWVATARVGPFFKVENPPIENYRYRGVPAQARFRAAVAQSGPLQIELIQHLGDEPSVYRDTFPAGTGGFHHMCKIADDVEAEIAKLVAEGSPVAGQGSFGGANFAYVDTRPVLGYMSEFVQPTKDVLGFYEMVRTAADGWDGRDPVRDL